MVHNNNTYSTQTPYTGTQAPYGTPTAVEGAQGAHQTVHVHEKKPLPGTGMLQSATHKLGNLVHQADQKLQKHMIPKTQTTVNTYAHPPGTTGTYAHGAAAAEPTVMHNQTATYAGSPAQQYNGTQSTYSSHTTVEGAHGANMHGAAPHQTVHTHEKKPLPGTGFLQSATHKLGNLVQQADQKLQKQNVPKTQTTVNTYAHPPGTTGTYAQGVAAAEPAVVHKETATYVGTPVQHGFAQGQAHGPTGY